MAEALIWAISLRNCSRRSGCTSRRYALSARNDDCGFSVSDERLIFFAAKYAFDCYVISDEVVGLSQKSDRV